MKARTKKLLLAGLSVLVTLLFAELALRILGIGAVSRGSPWFAGGNHPRFLFQPDPASGYALRPGFRGREIAFSKEFDVPVAVSERGIREHSHIAGPQPAVLALGDSMTFGEGVTADRTWSAVLEQESRVRVYNGGVPGYSTHQMAGRARRLIPVFQPKLVLVLLSPQWDRNRSANPFFYLGGYIVSESYQERLFLIGDDLYLAETRVPGIGAATAWAKRYSYLARLALPPLGDASRALFGKKAEPLRLSARDYEPTAQTLIAIREEARKAGAGFLAILIESRSRGQEIDQLNLGMVLPRNMPSVALDSFLPEADWRRLRYPQDQHWNEDGHRTVGTALVPVVRALLEDPLRW
jgi:hypothetical protein